jgi:hypothetical protein
MIPPSESGKWIQVMRDRSIHIRADVSFTLVIEQIFSAQKCFLILLECEFETSQRRYNIKTLVNSATAAGDNQVRVFDIKGSLPGSAVEQEVQVSTHSCINISDCHTDRAKKVVTEDTPDLFLSVGEV